MKNIKYILTLLLAISFFACDTVDFADTNKNVNGPSDPSYTAGLFSGAIMSFATYTGRDGLMKPTLYVQWQVQVTYTDEMLYAEVPSSWFTWYVRSLQPLQQVINYVSKPENQTPAFLAKQGSVGNQIGTAMIMKSIVMKRVTDTYGDVPYSDALQGLDDLTPGYDVQQDILLGLIADLKAGRDMLNNAEAKPLGDILYAGDMNKWKKLANSEIMQIALTMSKRYPAASGIAATEFAAALNHAAGVIATVADEAWFTFTDLEGFRNPWNQNRTPDYFLSREFTDAMYGKVTIPPAFPGDPAAYTSLSPTSNTRFDDRIKVYAKSSTLPGVPYGHDNGTGAGANQVSTKYWWNNTTSLPLMTASYVYLNRAEAATRIWTLEDPATMLTNGIVMSYSTLDAHFASVTGYAPISGTAAAYAAARVTDAATVGLPRVIAEEKWVSLFSQGFEAWTEWRRTNIPTLLPAVDYYNNGNIPRRYLYPIEETSLNGSARTAGISALVPAEDKGTSKVWWDQ